MSGRIARDEHFGSVSDGVVLQHSDKVHMRHVAHSLPVHLHNDVAFEKVGTLVGEQYGLYSLA